MNFVDLMSEHNIPVRKEGHEHCRPGWVQIDCPFCSPQSGHWRLGWNLAYNYGNCWACGHHGLVEIMVALTGDKGSKFFKLAKDLERVRVERAGPIKRGEVTLPKGLGKLQYTHKEFLVRRRFGPRLEELQKLWSIQGIGIASQYAWSIFIPIHFRGEVVSWTTRSISDNGSYRSARADQESIFHKHLLYGEDYVRHTAILVEGPLDVWAIGPGAVCSFGLNYTPQQLTRFRAFARRVVCLDNEPAAQKVAARICQLMQPFPGETINVVLETGKDASRASKSEMDKLRQTFLED